MLLVYEVHPCSCQVWWGVPEIQTFGRLRHEDHQFQAVLATQRNNRTQYATAQGLQHTGPSSGTFSASPPISSSVPQNEGDSSQWISHPQALSTSSCWRPHASTAMYPIKRGSPHTARSRQRSRGRNEAVFVGVHGGSGG